jgi:hypothetical protein
LPDRHRQVVARLIDVGMIHGSSTDNFVKEFDDRWQNSALVALKYSRRDCLTPPVLLEISEKRTNRGGRPARFVAIEFVREYCGLGQRAGQEPSATQ